MIFCVTSKNVSGFGLLPLFKESPFVSSTEQHAVDKCYPCLQQSISQLFHPVQSVFAVSPDMRALICSVCLQWVVNCHGSVTGLWVFLPFDRIHSAALLCQKWLITASLYGNMEATTSWWSISAAFDVALISLCVVWVVKEQSNIIWDLHHWAAMGVQIISESENIVLIQLRFVFLNSRANKTWICDSCTSFAFKYVHLSSYKSAKDNKNTPPMA